LPPKLNEIPLNDLPKWSGWPARLIGTEDFAAVTRDLNKIHAEYSEDKWQKCADMFDAAGGKVDAFELRRMIYDLHSDKRRAAIVNGALVDASNADVMAWYDEILTSAMSDAVKSAKTIIELGCGMGHMLWVLRSCFPGLAYRGGDYAETAVSLAARLYQKTPDISVEKFNFYDSTYDIVEKSEGPVVIFTSQALEQVPTSATVIETLSKYKKKIARVFHMEPAYAFYDDGTLLGQLRRRYIELNDYNRDLVPTLRSRPDVEVLRQELHIVGWNPFNSLALTEWRFR
jgi:hypothetical protein